MNDTINTGGCAFPVAFVQGADPHGADAAPGNDGMTLLDWFAGQALNGWAAGRNNGMESTSSKPASVAATSYLYAEAMLAEKARREATCKDGLQVPDHSPDAGKMARLEEENRELVEALKSVLDCITETRGPNAFVAVADAKEILAKHQKQKKETKP